MISTKMSAIFDALPTGPGRRILIGQIAAGQGLAYLYISLNGQALTTSYQRQATIAPLWVWGGVLLVLRLLFWGTFSIRVRRSWIGRLIAVLLLAVNVWFAASFALAGAWAAVGQYIPIVAVILGEATSVKTNGL